jgi:hypothetical protein
MEMQSVHSYQGRVYHPLVQVDLEPPVQEDSGGRAG